MINSAQKRRHTGWRVNLFALVVIVAAGLIFFQLFSLTYLKHAVYVRSAQTQHNNPAALISGRGDIYASDLGDGSRHLIATNRSFWYVYTNTNSVTSPDEAASAITGVLNLDREAILGKLKARGYQVVADHLNKEDGAKVSALKLKGITVATEIGRYYPGGQMLASTLGFVGSNSAGKSGRYGIESYYDDVLSGITRTLIPAGNRTYSGVVKFFKSLFGSDVEIKTAAQSGGSDLVLTVDYNIQAFVETKLDETLKKWSATGGSVIVEDPATGAILAMVSSPSFDPNNYSASDLSRFLNRNTQELFEPGSSFKSITMSSAIDAGVVSPDTIYEDTGAIQYGTYTIRNFNEKANGIQTMRQVLEHSLNTGAIFAENKTGDDKFLNYVVGFGFGQKSGVDLPGEISGNISNLYSGRKINFATSSFGQGIAVTPLQLINAYSTIANGGKLMRPYIVKEIVHADGSRETTQPKVLGIPITEKTSATMKSMLADVVEKGFDKARIKGYDLAGKTGTAQIPDERGGYLDNNQFVHNFLGFAPAYSPKFVVLIKMDKPQGIKFAADSLSPVFGDIARYLIRYFKIPPTH